MSDIGSPKESFWNYPTPKEAPTRPFVLDTARNPALRGIPLSIAASLISWSTLLQSFFWTNAGFDKLRIPELHDYDARYDPTVIPITDKPSSSVQGFPAPRKRRSENEYLSAADYHELYRSGQLTPTSVAECLLPLIRRDTTPPGAHSIAFLDSNVKLVMAAAIASTRRYRQGEPLSVLDGVPVAVKDEVELEGYKKFLGSKMDFSGKTGGTSWCVKKWEEAGAVIIGKTNMHELGLDVTNNNANTGTPLNPQNPNYYTGGSSGGSAYAVAAGLVPIALGADGGGSIRIPASFCGVYGIKPSHGRVSGIPNKDLATTTGVYGPLAASIDDLALAYRIMAAPDPENKTSSMFPPATSPLASAPKTLGIFREWFESADPAVVKVCQQAIEHYTDIGYTTVEINIPFLLECQKAHALTILTEIASGLTPDQIPQLTAPNKVLMSVPGSQARAQDFVAAQKLRNMLMQHLAFLWKKHPGLILVTPTIPMAGWKIQGPVDLKRGISDGDTTIKCMRYAWMANLTGCPAISCPVGYCPGEGGDLPVGLMGMGEWGSEEQLLQFGKDGENTLGPEGVRRPKDNGKFVDVAKLATGKVVED